MKKNFVKSAAAVGLCLTLLAGGVTASAAYIGRNAGGAADDTGSGMEPGQMDGRMIVSDAGIDYDGELYLSDGFSLNNSSGVAGPDNMGGFGGQMGGFQMGR